MTLSYNGSHSPTVIMEMTEREPAGILNLGPMWRSIFEAWDSVNVPCCAMAVKQMIPDAHIGMIRNRHFVSSIFWTVHSLQGFEFEPSDWMSPSVIKAALFKNLIN